MAKKNHIKKPAEVQEHNKHPELPHEYIPEEPIIPDEDSDGGTVYDEDDFENPPYEAPPPGEGP